MKSFRLFIIIFLFLYITDISAQSKKEVVNEEVVGHIFKPIKVEPTDERVKSLDLPQGFTISKFYEGLKSPRMIAVNTDGTVYITQRDAGNVVMLKDINKDGKADERAVITTLPSVHGIALYNKKMYLITVNDVYSADIKKDGSIGELQKIITGLPEGGQHPNRTIEFGPDDKLYISVGSTCNACGETNKENATILQADADGKNRRIYASGLRNTIGFDWHPQTKILYGMDHGIDWLGDNEQKEELNQIKDGAIYGWPYIYDNSKRNKADEPDSLTYEQYAAIAEEPEMLFTAHSAPMDFLFNRGNMFPSEYKNSAFVTFHGSWNRKPPSGYKIMWVRFENGEPVKQEDFVTGFISDDGKEQFGRLVGLAQHPDGSLLVTDDDNGVVYRIAYGK